MEKNTNLRPFQQIVPQLAASAYVDPAACVIGDVKLGENVSVWPMTVIRGDVNYIIIGDDCNIQDGSILHVTHKNASNPHGDPLILGKGVTVGHGAILHACQIDDYCLVGMGATVLDRAVMEHHSMLGAGSLLPPGKVIKTGELWLGNPAKKVRQLTPQQIEHLEYSAAHYIRLKKQFQETAAKAKQ